MKASQVIGGLAWSAMMSTVCLGQNPGTPAPGPRAPGPGAPAPRQAGPMGPQAQAVPERELPLGPLDPGPYPIAPGYFTRKSVDLNYRQTPFFNNGGGAYYGWGANQDYFPGVYPYYDAQYHYQWYLAYHREQQVTKRAETMRGSALDLFHQGDYETAALRYLGAADLNQGDAAARIHAGQCLFALGRYNDAVAMLRRAFELQPSLAYGGYNPRTDYDRQGDFIDQMKTLRSYVEQAPKDAAARALLGYMSFFTEGPSRARPILEVAHDLNPTESLVNKLLGVASKASFNDAIVKTHKDSRTYDQMGIKPKPDVPYDQPRPAAVKRKPAAKQTSKDEDRLRRA